MSARKEVGLDGALLLTHQDWGFVVIQKLSEIQDHTVFDVEEGKQAESYSG